MKITKENFIEEFIKLSIEQGKMFDGKDSDRIVVNKLATQLGKYTDFLVKDIEFAKYVLDELIKNEDYYIQSSIAFMLWEFDYKLDESDRIFRRLLKNKEIQYNLSKCFIDAAYRSIKDGRAKKRREFPKLD